MIAKSKNADGEIVIWKTPYNHDVDYEAVRLALTCDDLSLTQQNFKDQVDINRIVEGFTRTGELPLIPMPLQYADLATMDDYHTMANKLAETNALFYKLPPDIREEYSNNPGAWLQDVNEKLAAGDIEPLRDMGLDLKTLDEQIRTLEGEAALARREALADEAAKRKGGTTPATPVAEPPKREALPPST